MPKVTLGAGVFWGRFFANRAVLSQRSFAFSKYGGEELALESAKRWRARELRRLTSAGLMRRSGLRSRPMSGKLSACPVGISASIRGDKRKRSGTKYLAYQVAYVTTTGAKTNKTFQVGNVDVITLADMRHAARAAMACRDEYVWCREKNRPFTLARYRNWRHDKVYPFVPPNS